MRRRPPREPSASYRGSETMTARAPRVRHIAAAVSPSMPAPRISHDGPGNIAASPKGGCDRGRRSIRRTRDFVRKIGGNLDDGGSPREVTMRCESAAQRMLVSHLLVPVFEKERPTIISAGPKVIEAGTHSYFPFIVRSPTINLESKRFVDGFKKTPRHTIP